VLPATGRCPHCKARIGPDALAVEVVTGLVLAVVAARASSGWELAALAWLALIAVPLAFIDIAVQRLPDLLTVSAFAGTIVLLAAAEGAAHQPWPLVRAVIGAAALAGFYLALWLVFPDQLGLGDVFPELKMLMATVTGEGPVTESNWEGFSLLGFPGVSVMPFVSLDRCHSAEGRAQARDTYYSRWGEAGRRGWRPGDGAPARVGGQAFRGCRWRGHS
jgi:hypothetical protein